MLEILGLQSFVRFKSASMGVFVAWILDTSKLQISHHGSIKDDTIGVRFCETVSCPLGNMEIKPNSRPDQLKIGTET